jgi:hypothetical protein
MDAAEVIALADAMRAYALESGRDLNAANLFTHTMLMRKLMAEQNNEPLELNRPDYDAA